jgi:MYXO-CTERM domain-containing protein
MQNDSPFATATDMLPATIAAAGNSPPGSSGAITNTAAAGSITYWGVRPIDVDLVDVDNDFDLDIMVDHRNGFSRIFLNDGHGHFTDGTNFKLTTSADGLTQTVSSNFPLKRGPYVYNQEFCDIDEDGDLDMLLDNVGPKPVNNQSWAPGGGTGSTIDVSQISINDGHGKFVDDTANRIIGELGGDDNAVKCADFNGDGHYDLVVATLSGRSEKFLLNDGTAHFNMIGDAIPVVADSSLAIDAADLNGDKIMDLVTGSGESNAGNWQNRVYLGGGPSVPDHTPPAFRAIQTPIPLADTPTVIRFALRDATTSATGQMVKSATVNYTVTGGATKAAKAVWYGGDLFRATIPAQTAGTEVTVTLSAVDRAGNTGSATPFKFTVPTPQIVTPPAGGAGGTGGTGGSATGGGGSGGTGGVAGGTGGTGGSSEAGAAGATPIEAGAGGVVDEPGGSSAGGASGGKAGAGSKAGASSGGDEPAEAGAGDTTSTAGGTSHPATSDDGGCSISESTPANKGRGAMLLGFGLAMFGLVRRRRNDKQ